jgi:hypothetical protein
MAKKQTMLDAMCDHLEKCSACEKAKAATHRALSELHESYGGTEEKAMGAEHREFHRHASELHKSLAEHCDQKAEVHEDSMKSLGELGGEGDSGKAFGGLTDTERAILAKLARTVVPDRVRGAGTESPNRLIARQGDPQPETSDTEIPQEFVDVFAV